MKVLCFSYKDGIQLYKKSSDKDFFNNPDPWIGYYKSFRRKKRYRYVIEPKYKCSAAYTTTE